MKTSKRAFSRRARLILVAVLLVALPVCTLPFPQSVNLTLDGIRVSTEDEFVFLGNTELRIVGKFYRYLFRADRFEVKIYIDDELFSPLPFNMQAWNGYLVGVITYYNAYQNRMESLGQMVVSKSLDEFALMQKDWITIYAPASSAEEALRIATKMGFA